MQKKKTKQNQRRRDKFIGETYLFFGVWYNIK